jgi:hypothetical protein
MLYPVAIINPIAGDTPIAAASHRMPKKVATTTATTAASARGPRSPRSPSDRRTPSTTMPARSTWRAARRKPGRNIDSTCPKVAPAMPHATARTCADSAETRRFTSTATTATAKATTSPGR